MEEKEKKNPYGVFNPDTKKWDGAEEGIDAQDYIKRRQVYGGDEWATGKGKAKELHGSDYGDAKDKWLAEGKSEEGFSSNYFAAGGEGTLGGTRHKANVDRGLRAQEDEKQWRAGQAAGYEKLGEKGQRTAGIQAGNNIKKDKELYSKVTGSRGDSYGVKDLFNKMTGGGGYGGTPNTLSGEERAKMVQGLEKLGVNPGSVFRDLQSGSPMKRNSPFKKLGEIRRHTYEDRSNLIGGKVEDAFEEKRQREKAEREESRQAQQDEMRQLQMSQLKQAQYEALNVPADTGIKTADQYLQGASRQMVDAQAALVGSLKNGEIDTDQFAQKSAMIKSQIPALRKSKEVLTNFQNQYTDLLSQNKISKSDDGKAGQIYNLLQSGAMSIEPDENGQMFMKSPEGWAAENGFGEDVNIPLSQIDRLPKATPQAPEMSDLIAPAIKDIGDGEWGDGEAVKKQIDALFTGNMVQDEKTLKALAVDRVGLSLEDADELLNDTESVKGTEYANALEQRIEGDLLKEAKHVYDGNMVKREQAKANLRLREAQAANQERLVRDPNNGAAKQTAVMLNSQLEQQQSQAAYNSLNETVTKTLPEGGIMDEEQANSFTSALRSKLPPGVKVKYSVPSKYFGLGGGDYSKGGNIIFTDSEGEEIESVPSNNRALLDQWLKNFTGVKPGQ